MRPLDNNVLTLGCVRALVRRRYSIVVPPSLELAIEAEEEKVLEERA